MARTITLNLSEEFDNVNHANKKNVDGAIGYLSSWALSSARYAVLSIYGSDNGDLCALYKDGEGKVTYEIGGVRREDGSYSFHS